MRFERILPPDGPILVYRDVHSDERGSFVEGYRTGPYREAGIQLPFAQANVSRSRRGVLRGLHFQHPHPQGKLVSVTRGEIYDVAVDIRVGSPTFARWVAARLSDENGRQLWVPPDFAHGFVALSEQADVLYQCTETWQPECEHTLRWDDPALAIEWPLTSPHLSSRDAEGGTLEQLLRDGSLPLYPSAVGVA